MHNSSDQSTEIDYRKRLFRVFDRLSKHDDLAPGEAEFAAKVILDGLASNRVDVSDLLIGFFGGLTIKDPTLNELTGMAAAMEATKKFRFHFNREQATGHGRRYWWGHNTNHKRHHSSGDSRRCSGIIRPEERCKGLLVQDGII